MIKATKFLSLSTSLLTLPKGATAGPLGEGDRETHEYYYKSIMMCLSHNAASVGSIIIQQDSTKCNNIYNLVALNSIIANNEVVGTITFSVYTLITLFYLENSVSDKKL